MTSRLTPTARQASDIIATWFNDIILLSNSMHIDVVLDRAAQIESAALNVLTDDDGDFRNYVIVSCDEMRFVASLLIPDDAQADTVVPRLFTRINDNSSTGEVILGRCALAFSHWLVRKCHPDTAIATLRSVLPRVRNRTMKAQIIAALRALLT